MSTYTSRALAGERDLGLILEFARRATAERWPRSTYWHAGDVVWQVFPYVGAAPAADIRLWFDGEPLVGVVVFEPPLNFEFDVCGGGDPDGPLLPEMLAWAEDRRRQLLRAGDGDVAQAYAMLGDGVATSALESDVERIGFLERHGYRPSERHNMCYARGLDVRVPNCRLPDGMRVRHATDADIAERVDLHRDAWSVWGPSTATIDAYRRLRSAPLYDEELDVVVEAEDGKLVSYCICWVDAANGVATFEPVGTRTGYTGRGLAREAIFEGFRRLAERGMHTALVGTASVNERALRLYLSCGFEVVDRRRYYVKAVSPT